MVDSRMDGGWRVSLARRRNVRRIRLEQHSFARLVLRSVGQWQDRLVDQLGDLSPAPLRLSARRRIAITMKRDGCARATVPVEYRDERTGRPSNPGVVDGRRI